MLVAVVAAMVARVRPRPRGRAASASSGSCRAACRRSRIPRRTLERPPAPRRGRLRDRGRVARRHDLHVVGVRRAHRPGGPGEPGDGRASGRRTSRPACSGLPGQHERLADRRRRAGRREDAAHRPRRRGGDRRHARVPARPDAVPPAADARRRGHRGLGVARRHPGDPPAVAPAPDASSRCRWRRSSAWRCSASCPASRSPSSCRSSTCSAAPGRPTGRSSATSPGVPGYHDIADVPGRRAGTRAWSSIRFDGPLIFANATTFRDGDPAPRPRRSAAALDPRRRRADDRHRHDRGRHARGARPGAGGGRHRTSSSPR